MFERLEESAMYRWHSKDYYGGEGKCGWNLKMVLLQRYVNPMEIRLIFISYVNLCRYVVYFNNKI